MASQDLVRSFLSVGNRTRLTWPDGYYATYAYDASNRLMEVRENGAALLANYAYETYGRPAWVNYGGRSDHAVSYAWSPEDELNTYSNNLAGAAYDVDYTNSFTPARQIASAVISNDAFACSTAQTASKNFKRRHNPSCSRIHSYRCQRPVLRLHLPLRITNKPCVACVPSRVA